MAFTLSSKTKTTDHTSSAYSADHQDEEEQITSQLHLKPTHTTGTLDKEVILRRIRQRKRVNQVRSVLQSLLGSPFSAKSANKDKSAVPEKKWWEDAFSAP
ncbi:hypothetical protein ACHQM5_023338 [Ranunculus cassubicifolius]